MTDSKPFQEWLDQSKNPPLDKKTQKLFQTEGAERRARLMELLRKRHTRDESASQNN